MKIDKIKTMKQIDVYTTSGKKQRKINIPKALDVEIKPKLIAQAYIAETSQKKFSTSHTKNRGEVQGSGRKPWRQKGTGRARAGSFRSPLWRGGGIIFGPTPVKNFKKRIPKRQKRAALKSALSAKIKDKKIIIISKIVQKNIKTNEFEKKIQELPIDGTALIVLEKRDEKIEKSAANIPYLKVIDYKKLGLVDLLSFDFIIITKDVLEKIAEATK